MTYGSAVVPASVVVTAVVVVAAAVVVDAATSVVVVVGGAVVAHRWQNKVIEVVVATVDVSATLNLSTLRAVAKQPGVCAALSISSAPVSECPTNTAAASHDAKSSMRQYPSKSEQSTTDPVEDI